MFTAAVLLLLAGSLLLFWTGYLEGWSSMVDLEGRQPEQAAMVRRHRRLYAACMAAAFLSVLLVPALVGAFRIAEVDEAWLPAALRAAAVSPVIGLALAGWRWRLVQSGR